MGLTKTLIISIAFFLMGAGLYAQNTVPGQLGAEIQTLEQKLSPNTSFAERYNALVRLAKLRQLSGNIADAAANWLDAAAANPQDDAALVSGAYCLAAIGEWEKAASTLRPLLAADRAGPAMPQARFLDACLRAWSAGDASALTTLAANPEFAAMRPLLYYTLWQTLSRNPEAATTSATGTDDANSWRSRLLAEFPQSPEARAADYGRTANPGSEKDSPVVSAVQSPLWQLLPGKAATAPAAPATAAPAPAKPAPAPVTPSAPAPVTVTPTPPPPTPAPVTPATSTQAPVVYSGVVLQTGLFGKEANARAQCEALRKAGFTALISRKLVNGVEHWSVAVPAGQDQRKTTADLKKAGFDSFPVKRDL